jgi:cysteine sulfinate desulfinase/cysteine desulfurase-like protein
VLLAIGHTREEADSTIRIGVGRFNNEEEIATATSQILQAIDRLSAILK